MTGPQHPADLALQALAGGGIDDGPARVTNLSVDEAILLAQVDYEPLGVVTGAAVVHVSATAGLGAGMGTNDELIQLTEVVHDARTRAVDRLMRAAAGLRADGVVGVTFEVGELTDRRFVEVVATGTAVEGPYAETPAPFTAALGGQELHLLERAGYRPVGIVSGVCVYHVGRRGPAAALAAAGTNQELTLVTGALYEARELAMGRLQEAGLDLGADGVIGVTVTERSGVWGGHVIEFAAVGTAVASSDGRHRSLDPKLIMDLADQKTMK